MEGTFPRNVHSKITVTISSSRKTVFKFILAKNEIENSSLFTEWIKDSEEIHKKLAVIVIRAQVLDSINYRVSLKDYNLIESQILLAKLFFLILLVFDNISMLKRSYSMEFDSEHFKSAQHSDGAPPNENDENTQSSKKLCNSPERSNLEDKSPIERNDPSPENNNRRSEPYRRYPQTGETSHVTQSKSIFSHEDSIVYGNPKDDIKNIENPSTSEVSREMSPFDNNSINVLDLSCKSTRSDEEKPSQVSNEGNTYQSYHRSNYETPINRSNLEIKLVNPPTSKKPSIPEQLQIAKIQQQQRRSIQQQQKMLQQMRKSLDSSSSSASSKSSNRSHHTNNMDTSQGSHKNSKHYGNSTSNHEQNDVDNHARMKEEYHPSSIPGTHFPQPQYPYFDPAHIKELPDGHPILPLLDPVYFSAFYNAHGFLPPSSPSIAAAFIGTLQDALPKLPMMFPSTSSYNSSLLPQKSNENPN